MVLALCIEMCSALATRCPTLPDVARLCQSQTCLSAALSSRRIVTRQQVSPHGLGGARPWRRQAEIHGEATRKREEWHVLVACPDFELLQCEDSASLVLRGAAGLLSGVSGLLSGSGLQLGVSGLLRIVARGASGVLSVARGASGLLSGSGLLSPPMLHCLAGIGLDTAPTLCCFLARLPAH